MENIRRIFCLALKQPGYKKSSLPAFQHQPKTLSADVSALSGHSCTYQRTLTTDSKTAIEGKPYEDIPSLLPVKLPHIVHLFLHFIGRKVLHKSTQRFGAISKIELFGQRFVYIGDVHASHKLLRLDGRTPKRFQNMAWKKWREKHGHSPGILLSDGEEWKRMRKQLDKQMLDPRVVKTYADDFNEVITDFVQHIRSVRSDNGLVDRLDEELFHLSFEGIGKVLFGTRFGSFTPQGCNPQIDLFMHSTSQLAGTNDTISLLHMMHPYLLKTFGKKYQKKHDAAWDCIFSTGMKLIDDKIQEIRDDVAKGKKVDGFLSTLLASEHSDLKDVYASVIELLLAAGGTRHTMQWILYYLTRDAKSLVRLQEEVRNILPKGNTATTQDLQKMPYLKAVVKEVLRLAPVAPFLVRVTNQEMELVGYHIPSGTSVLCLIYAMARDPSIYPDPDSFKPERWLRNEYDRKQSFAWLPFGHGPRMCVGKRVVELEIHLLLARLVQEFDLSAGSDEEIHLINKGFLQPSKSVSIKFVDSA